MSAQLFSARAAAALLAYVCIFTGYSSAELSNGEVGKDPSVLPETEVPHDVQGDGAFRYSLDFAIPEFRGLEPRLGLSYNSSFKGRGRAETWLGVGWQLKGFSSIERVSVGGGTPTYDNQHDLFRLDGVELMACRDSAATNPLPGSRAYPGRYQTDTASASCRAGGNMSAIVENYRKIEMKYETVGGQQVEYFEVTNDKGVVYIYRALGAINGDTSSGDEFDALFRRKFLLTEIRDTQQSANTVTYNYFFESKANARAHRPASVTYANGYKVVFRYEAQSEPVASYAVGTAGQFGRQYNRLKSVFVKDGSQQIRAYKLEYQRSAVTQAHQLSRVRLYGSDYKVDANNTITGGSQLPSPLKDLTYASDGVALQKKTYNNTTFLRNVRVFDSDGDNRDELVQPSLRTSDVVPAQFPTCVSSEYQYSTFAKSVPQIYSVPSAGSRNMVGSDTHAVWSKPLTVRDESLPSNTASSYYPGSVLPRTPAVDQPFLPLGEQTYYKEVQSPVLPGPYKFEMVGLNGGSSSLVIPNGANHGNSIFGNFDTDPEHEAIVPLSNSVSYLFNLEPGSADPVSIGWPTAGNQIRTLDLDGDGMLELLPRLPQYPTPTSNWWEVWDFRGGLIRRDETPPPGQSFHNMAIADRPGQHQPFTTADVNGDGKQDLVYAAGADHLRRLSVAISTGRNFSSPATWIDATQTSALTSGNGLGMAYAATAADVNGDGLDDIIVTKTLTGRGFGRCEDIINYTYTPVLKGSSGQVFLSTGSGFIAPEESGIPAIPGYIESGDFDGDGLPDFVSESKTEGSIWFGDGDVAHLLTGLTNGQGGETVVAYAPSTAIGNNNNDVPFVQQLVDSITVKDGRGQSRKTRFTYVNNAYDYENRRPLGYRTVTAYLPAVLGESEGPQVVTTYLNGHIGERGRIKSQLRKQDGTTYSQVINDWSDVNAGANGPYRVTRTSTRTRTRHGSKLIETMKGYEWTDYGQVRYVTDYGFTSNGGDLDAADNVLTRYTYQVNLPEYLVSFPVQKRIMKGTVDTNDRSKWLTVTQYVYEGSSLVWVPTASPNVVRVVEWNGAPGSGGVGFETRERFEYDAHGNLTKSIDARGNASVFAYDTIRHLFRVTETNAKGHVIATAWDQRCQQPDKVTDPNGLVTDYRYDIHCREDYVSLPSGDYVDTKYTSFGNPAAQYVSKISLSPSAASGSATQESREYFDGLGQVYRTAVSGTTSAKADMITTVKGFDQRGNLEWESIPLIFAGGDNASAIPTASKTRYSYDPLDRVTAKIHPDGATAKTSYKEHLVSGIYHPRMILRNEDCPPVGYAPNCIEVWHSYDARGNRVRMVMVDEERTDVGASGKYRITNYSFDLLNRLVGVTDPGGSAWAYSYDVRGNRLTSDDPALGYWTMQYDANNNLIRQVDAKGQVIEFTYDRINRVTEKKVTWTKGGSQSTDIVTSVYDQVPANGWKVSTGYNIGQLVVQSNSDHQIDYRYDNQGNPYWERHTVKASGKQYTVFRSYHASGALLHSELPEGTGKGRGATPGFRYDAAGRVTGFGSHITNVTYNLRGQPTWTDFSSGVREEVLYNDQRGWINRINVRSPAGSSSTFRDQRIYNRSKAGRVTRQDSKFVQSDFDYCYDYAGRLLVAADLKKAGLTCATIGSWSGVETRDQFFSYRPDGSMKSNSFIGNYNYSGTPVAHAPKGAGGDSFSYDANGNMLTGLDGKVMTYDGENRPLTVAKGGDSTKYTYAADGTRLKRVEVVDGVTKTSLYVGGVEIQYTGTAGPGGSDEEVHWYPHPSIRMDYANGVLEEVKFLHRDQLDSVIAITDEDGVRDVRRDFAPFGDEQETVSDAAMAGYPEKEDFGFIGEREDEAAGLMYLNARYYDPELASFIPADALAEAAGGPANRNAAPAEAPAQATTQ